MATEDLVLNIVTRGAGSASSQLGSVGKAGLALGAALTAATVGLGASVKAAMKYQDVMAEVQAVTNASRNDMAKLGDQATFFGAKYGVGSAEAAQAVAELAKGGLSTKTILSGGLYGAMNLAAAGGMSVADAATGAANALNLFGLKGSQTGHIADAFATAANATTADVSDFTMALSQGGSAAKAAGLSFDQTTVALEALAANGVKNSDAGTSLKSMLTQLASPTKDAAGVMSELNLEFFDAHGKFKGLADVSAMLRSRLGKMTQQQRLQVATTLAGTDGMRGLLSLYDTGPKKLRAFQQGLSKEGTAAEVARKKHATLSWQLKILRSTLEAVAIKRLLPFLTDATKWLNRMITQTRRGIGPFAAFGRGVRQAFGDAKKAAQDVFAFIGRTIDNNRGKIDAIINGFRNFGRLAGQALTTIKNAWSSVFGGQGGQGIGADIQKIISTLLSFYSTLINKVFNPLIKGALPGLGQAFRGIFTVVRGVVRLVSGVLTGDFGKAWQGVKDIFDGGVKAVGGVVRLMLNPVKKVVSAIKEAFSGIAGSLTGPFHSIVSFFVGALNDVIKLMNQAITAYNKIPLAPDIGTIGLVSDPYGGKRNTNLGAVASVQAKPSQYTNTTSLAGVRNASKAATGGVVKDGGWALVGERGPELAKLPGGSTVYDAKQTAGAMNGAQGWNPRFRLELGDSVSSSRDMRALAQLVTRAFVIEGAHG